MSDPATYVLIISIVINASGITEVSPEKSRAACLEKGRVLSEALAKRKIVAVYRCEPHTVNFPLVDVKPKAIEKPKEKVVLPGTGESGVPTGAKYPQSSPRQHDPVAHKHCRRKYRIVNHVRRWYFKCQ